MKYILYILFLFFLASGVNAQKDEKIVFLFNSKNQNMEYKKGNYLIDDYAFRKVDKKNFKKLVSVESIKSKLKTLSEFKEMIKGKPYPEIFSEFKLFIFEPKGSKKGCLIEVEKIWLVEDKTTN